MAGPRGQEEPGENDESTLAAIEGGDGSPVGDADQHRDHGDGQEVPPGGYGQGRGVGLTDERPGRRHRRHPHPEQGEFRAPSAERTLIRR